jgi:LysM repeat protein
VKTYTVQSGDTLGTIAAKLLGSSSRYMEIYNLNTDILSNPNLIQIGQVLTLPDTASVSSGGSDQGVIPSAQSVQKYLTNPKSIMIIAVALAALVFLFLPKKGASSVRNG